MDLKVIVKWMLTFGGKHYTLIQTYFSYVGKSWIIGKRGKINHAATENNLCSQEGSISKHLLSKMQSYFDLIFIEKESNIK